MGIPVKLPVFEGPLDLLLHLIEKNKVDIYDIPIVEITEQYLAYVKNMQSTDLNIMSEFMVMAATLISIKCKMLLPRQKDEEGEETDPREELVEQLLEYKTYKYMSYELRLRMQEAVRAIYKKPTIPKEVLSYRQPVDTKELLENVTISKLYQMFQEIIRKKEDSVDPIRSKFGKIEKEEISLPEQMIRLRQYMQEHREFSFRELLERKSSKTQVIVAFLAVLELMKSGEISVSQTALFEDIKICRRLGEEE